MQLAQPVDDADGDVERLAVVHRKDSAVRGASGAVAELIIGLKRDSPAQEWPKIISVLIAGC